VSVNEEYSRSGERGAIELLVIGLGNPGPEHADDRHNIGRMVVDELARRHSGSFYSRFVGRFTQIRLNRRLIGLLEPETYMNDSGRSVALGASAFGLAATSVVVVHDDIDLDGGRLRARLGGRSGGHNGVRSVARELGILDFIRVRVGVGRPGRVGSDGLSEYLLAPFGPGDTVGEFVASAADVVEAIAIEGLSAAQNRYNARPDSQVRMQQG
jgi:peptidyl-tRNA hydrolase, PTH1 family